jgi:hypothetical protein
VQPEERNPELRRMDMRMGLPAPTQDVRIGLPPQLGGQAIAVPGGPADLAAQKAAAEARAKAAETTEKTETAPSAIEQKLREGAAREPFRETPRTTPGALPGTPPGTPPGPGEEPEGPAMSPAPGKYLGPATFAEYLERARVKMTESHYGAADALYEAAMVMDANQSSALFGRIHAMLGDHRYLQAALVLDRALQRRPDWVAEVPDIKAAYTKPEVLTRITGDLMTSLRTGPPTSSRTS